MPLGPGGYDSNGIWLYGEDDSEALASDLLNIGMQSVSDVLGAGFGKILQVVSTSMTNTFVASVAQGTFTTITGLEASITPSSSSSKIIVMANVSGGFDSNLDRQQSYRILRDGTPVGIGAPSGNRQGISFQNSSNNTQTQRAIPSAGANFLDSPATTSSITYSVSVGHEGSTANIYINRSELDDNNVYTYRGISTLILMEVAG